MRESCSIAVSNAIKQSVNVTPEIVSSTEEDVKRIVFAPRPGMKGRLGIPCDWDGFDQVFPECIAV